MPGIPAVLHSPVEDQFAGSAHLSSIMALAELEGCWGSSVMPAPASLLLWGHCLVSVLFLKLLVYGITDSQNQ